MQHDEVFEKVCGVIREVLDKPDLVIDPETNANDVDGWDSFNHINIVVGIEIACGIKFKTAELEGLRNVGELTSLTEAKADARARR